MATAGAEVDRPTRERAAIGEDGLDYVRTGEDGRAAEHESFAAHIELAKRLDKNTMGDYVATAETGISASPAQVWEVLTDPEQIKKFMFGAAVRVRAGGLRAGQDSLQPSS
ncbi:MAG: TatD DNase family protein [Kribbellaceae bacterium]|jgi:hypothetical protein|nr:TatD DNase family protein [Kribbellaceae bacterium]